MERTIKDPDDHENSSSEHEFFQDENQDLLELSNTQRTQKPIPLLFERKLTRQFTKPLKHAPTLRKRSTSSHSDDVEEERRGLVKKRPKRKISSGSDEGKEKMMKI